MMRKKVLDKIYGWPLRACENINWVHVAGSCGHLMNLRVAYKIYWLNEAFVTNTAVWFVMSYIFNVDKNPTDARVSRYLFTAKLLYMFRVSQHPSSGVLKTVPAASGTGHNTCTATPLLHGLIWTGLYESSRQVVWPVPEAAGTVFNTPDDGCCDTRNM